MIYTFHFWPPLYSFWWIPTERWVFDPLFWPSYATGEWMFLRPRSSPEHGNTRGFSKWRFRKWRFLDVKVEGSEGEGPNKEENSGRRRFWVFQGFHRFPEGSGARLSEVPPDSWGYLCSVDPICGTPAFPGVLSCWTHSCSTGALGLLGEEVDFDWKGWQEYLVRWA